jgi:hypothetical protein
MGLWLTTSGVLYFPEYSNNCVRKVNTSNIISTVAGVGTNGGSGGFSGDGSPATLASLSNPGGVYMNTAGRLFIADLKNHRIRTVNTNGIIVTYAGTGSYSPFNGDYILRNLANLNSPWDVKGDNAGNIYITDSGNCLVRKIDAVGIITSLMGTAGQCGFSSGITSLRSSINNPIGLWVDELTSRVYVSDENSVHRSFVISSPTSQPSGQPTALPTVHSRSVTNMFMQALAGGGSTGYSGDNGPATSAKIRSLIPWVDTKGLVYLPDGDNYRIRKIDLFGIITTFGGTGNSSASGVGGSIMSVGFNNPYCIIGDPAGTILFISDSLYVWKYTFSTNTAVVFAHTKNVGTGFSGDNSPATSALLHGPLGLWLTTSLDLYIADYNNHRIRRVTASSGIITTVVGSGCTGGCPGSFSGDNAPATLATLSYPHGIYMDTIGRLFIADENNHRIRLVYTNNNNIIITFAGSGLTDFNGENIPILSANIQFPVDVKGDSLGNIYVGVRGHEIIRMVDITRGTVSTLFGTPMVRGFTGGLSPRTSSISTPQGIWVDSLSNIYFSDYNSIHRSVTVSSPSSQPSGKPTGQPTGRPSRQPSSQPSRRPSGQPTRQPTSKPSIDQHSLQSSRKLVASYSFSGNALDGSGNGNHGTVHSATLTTDRFGNNNNAYSFNGVNSYIEIVDGGAFNFVNELTISIWVKPASSQQSSAALLSKSHGAAGWSIEQAGAVNNQYKFVDYMPTEGLSLVPAQLYSNAWNHLVIIKKDLRVYSYLNNILAATDNVSTPVIVSNGFKPLTIGGWNSVQSQPATQLARFFTGILDDIRIYNRSLSRSEVSELFFAENPVPSRKSVFLLYNSANTYSIQSLITNPTDSSSYFLGGNAAVSGGTNSLLGKFRDNGNKEWVYEQTVGSYSKPDIQTLTTLDDGFLYAGGRILPPSTFPGYNGNFVPYFSRNSLVDGTLLSVWALSQTGNVRMMFFPATNNSIHCFGGTGTLMGEIRPAQQNIISVAYIGIPGYNDPITLTVAPMNSNCYIVGGAVREFANNNNVGWLTKISYNGTTWKSHWIRIIKHTDMSLVDVIIRSIAVQNNTVIFAGSAGGGLLGSVDGRTGASNWITFLGGGIGVSALYNLALKTVNKFPRRESTIVVAGGECTGGAACYFLVNIHNGTLAKGVLLPGSGASVNKLVGNNDGTITFVGPSNYGGLKLMIGTLDENGEINSAILPVARQYINNAYLNVILGPGSISNIKGNITISQGSLTLIPISTSIFSTVNDPVTALWPPSPTSQPSGQPTRQPSSHPSSHPTVRVPASLKSGLVAYFPFDGNAYDNSGNGNNGVINGNTSLTTDRFGNPGSAYYFGGTDGYIKIANGQQFNFVADMSISFWVLPHPTQGYASTIFDKSHLRNNQAFFITIVGGNDYSYGYFYPDGNNHQTGFSTFPSQWNHIVVVKDKQNIMIYHNLFITTSDQGGSPFIASNGNSPFAIGATITESPAFFFKGKLDDIFFYNRSLTFAEVQSLYNFDSPTSQPSKQPSSHPTRQPSSQPSAQPTRSPFIDPLTNGLIAYYPFDGNTQDVSGHGNHGIAHGGVTLGDTDRFGFPNSCYLFDGTSGYIEIPGQSLNDLQNFSLSLWINHRGGSIGNTLFDKSTSNGASGRSGGYALRQITYDTSQTDTYDFYYVNSSHNFNFAGFPVYYGPWNWHHYVVTLQNTRCCVYSDGTSRGCKSLSSNILSNGNLPLILGAVNYGGTNTASSLGGFYHGLMDDVFIFDRALTVSDVKALFNFNSPTSRPSEQPSSRPSRQPNSRPTGQPSGQPTFRPTGQPTSFISGILKEGLVAVYPFDGNARDQSGNGHNGEVFNVTLTPDRFGNSKSAYAFSGSSRITVQNGLPFDFSNSFSVSFWIYPTSPSSNLLLMSKSYLANGQSSWFLYQSDLDYFFMSYRRANDWEQSSTTNLNFNQWQHYAITKENALVSSYVNGKLVDTAQGVTPATVKTNGNLPFFIGGGDPGADLFFKGQLDDIFIYNRSLTAQEVLKLSQFDAPTSQPTSDPTRQPSSQPSRQPSSQPSSHPSRQPSTKPSSQPSTLPTKQPTGHPSGQPTDQPTKQPLSWPTGQPMNDPSTQPTKMPSFQPTAHPSTQPSTQPSNRPSSLPTTQPSGQPSVQPTVCPSGLPSRRPSVIPSSFPTRIPSLQPISTPSRQPTSQPSTQPTTQPTGLPTSQPTGFPSTLPSCQPSCFPTNQPTTRPTDIPSDQPTESPSSTPSGSPTRQPSQSPSGLPSTNPSTQPSDRPTAQPSDLPTNLPTSPPTSQPSITPTGSPSRLPSSSPSSQPTRFPTSQPSNRPSCLPTTFPSGCPSSQPSGHPTSQPSILPSTHPSARPSLKPSSVPSVGPSTQPSRQPSSRPSSQPTLSPSSLPTGWPTFRPSSQPSCSPTNSPTSKPSKQPNSRPTSQPSSRPTAEPSSSPITTGSLQPQAPIPLLHILPFKSLNFKETMLYLGSFLPTTTGETHNIVLGEPLVGSSYIVFGFNTNEKKQKLKELTIESTDSLALYAPLLNTASGGLIPDREVSRSSLPIGDFNGDSQEDLLVCDPVNTICRVYFGQKGNEEFSANVNFVIENDANDLFGWSTARLDDLNRDGCYDIAISSLSSNMIYLIWGNKFSITGPAVQRTVLIQNKDLASSSVGIRIIGSQSDQNMGLALSSAGDFNHDGSLDLLFSAMQISPYQNLIYILFLHPSVLQQDILLDKLTANKDYMKITAPVFAFAGFSLSNLGDMNQDGFDDIIVGSIPYSGRYLTQKGYVIYGRNNSFSSSVLDLSTMTEEDGFIIIGGGFMVAGPGDVNNDGIPDIMISSYQQWQGKGNSYLMTYPRDITSPPTFLPSSLPSSTPSMSPSAHPSIKIPFPTSSPTVAATTAQPVSEGTFPPFLPQTLAPSLAPKTTKPTRNPSIKPSTRSPTVQTTSIPSLFPSRSPTVSPTKNPSPFPTTTIPSRSPSKRPVIVKNNFPTSFPSVTPTSPSLDTIPAQEISIEEEGIYNEPSGKGNYIISGKGNIQITGNGGGKKIYTILPAENSITITDFNRKSDQISLVHFPSLSSINDLAYRTNPFQIILASSSSLQSVFLPSLEVTDLTEENFIFQTKNDPREQPANDFHLELSSIISLGILFGCVGIFGCFAKLNKSNEEDNDPKRKMLSVVDEQEKELDDGEVSDLDDSLIISSSESDRFEDYNDDTDDSESLIALGDGEDQSNRSNRSENDSEGDFRFLQELLEGNLNQRYHEEEQREGNKENEFDYNDRYSLLNVFNAPDEDQRLFDGFVEHESESPDEKSDEEAHDHRYIEGIEMEAGMPEEDISFVQQFFPPRR